MNPLQEFGVKKADLHGILAPHKMTYFLLDDPMEGGMGDLPHGRTDGVMDG